jgi:hypothetical protein
MDRRYASNDTRVTQSVRPTLLDLHYLSIDIAYACIDSGTAQCLTVSVVIVVLHDRKRAGASNKDAHDH